MDRSFVARACRLKPAVELGYGDLYSLLCIRLAKKVRLAPAELAQRLMQNLPQRYQINFSSLNGYLNFRVPDRELFVLNPDAATSVGHEVFKNKLDPCLKIEFRRGSFFANLKYWARLCLQTSSLQAQHGSCDLVLQHGLDRLITEIADSKQASQLLKLKADGQAVQAALNYYVLTLTRADELDWAVVKLAEKANLVWYLYCTLARLKHFGFAREEDCSEIELDAPLPLPLREICVRVKLLGRFFNFVAEGEVEPYVLALSSLLSNVNALINSPDFRKRLHISAFSGIEGRLLAGVNTVLSAMINRCSVLYLTREFPGVAQQGLISDKVLN